MRATTKEQKEVERLHGLLPALTMAQLNWIVGQDYERSAKEYSKTGKMVTSYDYFAVITTFKDWQVNRYFLIHSKTTRNGYKLEYLEEVSQRWMRIKEYGNIELHIFELPKVMCWRWQSQPYSLSSPLTLKPWSKDWDRGGRTYFNMADCEIVPGRRFSKEFKDAGLAKACGRVDEIELAISRKGADKIKSLRLSKKWLMKTTKKCYLPSKCETLFKLGETQLALDCLGQSCYAGYIETYWRSFLIARRHGLKLKDWHLWFDYVHDLDMVGRDVHSPKYLVPADIGTAHGRVLAMLEKMRDELARQREKATIDKYEKDYAERMSKYFGIIITTKSGLTITPLQSVMAFYEEGTAMHHCVYTCGYYKNGRSLILSARDKDGKRVETIEINLNSMIIAQSRGVCNKPTAYHDEIVRAVKRNMWKVSDIAKAA